MLGGMSKNEQIKFFDSQSNLCSNLNTKFEIFLEPWWNVNPGLRVEMIFRKERTAENEGLILK